MGVLQGRPRRRRRATRSRRRCAPAPGTRTSALTPRRSRPRRARRRDDAAGASRRRRPNLFVAIITLCVALLVAIAASAHEIGKTQVQASLRDGRYEIDVVVDPDALLSTLEALRSAADLARPAARRARSPDRGALPTCSSSGPASRSTARPAAPAFEYLPVVGVQRSRAGAVEGPADRRGARRRADVRLHLRPRARHLRAQRQDRRRPGRRPSGWSAARRARRSRWRRRCRRRRAPRSAWQYFALGFTHILPQRLRSRPVRASASSC